MPGFRGRPALLVLMMATAVAAQQPAPQQPPTGLIVGTVVDGDSGAPVGGAVVTLGGLPAGPAVPVPPGSPPQAPRVMTGADGRFFFRGLPKGSFTFTATQPAYLPGVYGRRSPASTASQSVDLEDEQRVSDVKIMLWRLGSISGQVIDEAGEPVVGVNVRAFRRIVVAGRVRLLQNAGDASQVTVTDDRGMYHYSRLAPGDYVVVMNAPATTIAAATQDAFLATARGGGLQDLQRELSASQAPQPVVPGIRVGEFVLAAGGNTIGPMPMGADGRVYWYPQTFYPGTTSVTQAIVVAVHPGEDRAGIDLRIKPAATVRVSGTIVGPSGPMANMGVRLVPAGAEEFTREPPNMSVATITEPSGAFTFLAVTPGQYTLRAERVPPRAPGPDSPVSPDATVWANAPVSVGNQDITDLAVRLAAGVRIRGRIELEGALPPPNPNRLRQIRVQVESPTGSAGGVMGLPGAQAPSVAQIDPSGALTTAGLPQGRYLITVSNVPAGWTLKSVMTGGRDASVTPFELGASDVEDVIVTLTDHPAELAGTVRNSQGAPDPTADVVVFPAEKKAWMEGGATPRMIRSTRVARDGTYKMAGLPPGDYYVTAIADEAIANWSEAKSLETLSTRALHIHIAEGGAQRQDLQTVKPR